MQLEAGKRLVLVFVFASVVALGLPSCGGNESTDPGPASTEAGPSVGETGTSSAASSQGGQTDPLTEGPAGPAELETIPDVYFETDVASLLTIHRPEDAKRLRRSLVELLWGEAMLPDSLPAKVEGNLGLPPGATPALARLDRLTVAMKFGMTSVVHLFHPAEANGRAVILHEGHQVDPEQTQGQVDRLVNNGYVVALFFMPLTGPNSQPTFESPRLGLIHLTHHEMLQHLTLERGHPMRYLLEPVIVMTNYLERELGIGSVSMVGLSGGGWTTTLVAAVDPRIAKSFPVAGSYPIYLRSGTPENWGDWEQTEPRVYNQVNYLELYVLGSFGEGREQLQVVNQYDSCCLRGLRWQTYRDVVTERVEQLGAGRFDVLLDGTHREHKISTFAMDSILDKLQVVP